MKQLLYSMDPENFGGLQEKYTDYAKSKIVVVPIPFDSTACSSPGQRFGPEALISASAGLELYDEEIDFEVHKEGICTTEHMECVRANVEENNLRIKKILQEFLDDGKFVVTLGGDHSITYGVLSAFAGQSKLKPFSVLQLDAHADVATDAEGSKYTHACVMRRAREEFTDNIVQVGLRSVSKEEIEYNKENIFLAIDLRKNFEAKIPEIVSRLKYDNVYITFDVDALDPSEMPATGTPEPGGLHYYDVLALLKAVCKEKNVIGFDCVELMPLPGNDAPNTVAAKIIYKLLGYKFKFSLG
ncbi:MAG TPA: agmatinase [Candidatus Norongarragalinales archaeon]|nr:agmatinase [Candidatus Norongarragalinales archaeon]